MKPSTHVHVTSMGSRPGPQIGAISNKSKSTGMMVDAPRQSYVEFRIFEPPSRSTQIAYPTLDPEKAQPVSC